ncbi:Crp/Fnr family transcriptional regulator [Pseudoflavonifractor sp. 524-17]|uniref:Crp/Fnr family transcriptional regulator n=1 Tax=Pseudoflavonifractor sp. 524-17 TaxID=2304577 RepID=UPI001FACC6D8|nr:Crp/Fnr family transcriptional regulator [Pseudoflavonifractor sp. 524-17]
MDRWFFLAQDQPLKHYAAGQFIYLQDTEADQFYYIASGTVKCFLSAESGEERILAFHHGGELIGEASFFDRQPRVSSAVAASPCQLIAIDRGHLQEVIHLHPDVALSLLEYLARTVRLLSVHVDGNFLPADQRIARHLLTLTPGPDGAILCTHEEIGASVGASRVTVSRTLAHFARMGWLQTGYRMVRLLNRSALERLLTATEELLH